MPRQPDFEERALSVLRRSLGATAQFRDQQLLAIQALAEDRRRVLVVQRTGWGKSAVYFVATRLLRDQGAGPTIIVSPLLALMRDQLEAAAKLGLTAKTINSSNTENWQQIEQEVLAGKIDLLLISPERLNNPAFRSNLLEPLSENAGLVVIDEAHCISDWGHDFRPDYRRVSRVLELLPPSVPVLATTATANNRVVNDIEEQLGSDIVTLRGTLDRESLALHTLHLDSQAERLAWLAETVPTIAGSGIVYCLTVEDTRRVADWLKLNGITAVSYSGADDAEQREAVEKDLKRNAVKVVAATSALGMGFDKPDLAFVVHFQSPDSPVSYYQQVGRAGRGIPEATAVLLTGAEDSEIWDYFLRTSLPIEGQADQVVAILQEAADWVHMSDLEKHINVPRGRLTALMKILDVEGVIEMRSTVSARRTLRPWKFDAERYERVRQARLTEQASMREYAKTGECRMAFLRGLLDDTNVKPCGRCDNCVGVSLASSVPQGMTLKALDFLRQRPVSFDPRKVWDGTFKRGKISTAELLKSGRALAYLSDPGWGRVLHRAKVNNFLLPDELVVAAAVFIGEWLDTSNLTIVYVPSFDPERQLVRDFAVRLAQNLSIPVAHTVVKTRHTQPQKMMENTTQQVANIAGAFELAGPVPKGPTLLIDDIVDSRWTLTYVGALLGEAGAGPIYPFAIARTKG